MAWPNVFDIDSSRLDPSGPTRPPKATVLLVHDAFHISEHLEALVNHLIAAGLAVICPQLPSSSETQLAGALEADMETIVEAGRHDLEVGKDLTIVMFGYGAIPGAMAAKNLNQHSLDTPRAGEVTQLLYASGVVLQRGESFVDAITPQWIETEVIEMMALTATYMLTE